MELSLDKHCSDAVSVGIECGSWTRVMRLVVIIVLSMIVDSGTTLENVAINDVLPVCH